MKKNRLGIFLIACLIMIFGCFQQFVFAEEPDSEEYSTDDYFEEQYDDSEILFPDVYDDDWGAEEIFSLYERGIIAGYPDNRFHPNWYITKEEFIALTIRALGLDDENVVDTLYFDDFSEEDWAWQDVQNAYYFELLPTPITMNEQGLFLFYPRHYISRAGAISIAVSALKVDPILKEKARLLLESKYDDSWNLPEWFVPIAASADVLDMLVINPYKTQLIDAESPITRDEAAVLIYNMLEGIKINPNDKIKEALKKKYASNGVVVTESHIDEDVLAVIPKGTILPVILAKRLSTEKAIDGDKYVAYAPKNYVHATETQLIPAGAKFRGHIEKVQMGQPFIRNGKITLINESIELLNEEPIPAYGRIVITSPDSKKLFWRIFKGKNFKVKRDSLVNMELLQDLIINASNGKLLEQNNL
ncbi:S-layer homology domain-containing protein [bacterium]|nr:S-layer homology domain-containing protein [bacterium]